MQNSKKMCKKCVLTESRPEIFLNEEGICNICIDYHRDEGKKVLLEFDFIKILDKYKNKNKYDCILMCSGGKDSISSLYLIKKRYHLHPLVFTFDHGFENVQAIENIKNAVRILEVDWIYYKTDYMKEAFKILVESRSKVTICHLCAIWYMNLIFDLAYKFNIPLIIGGWTKAQLSINKKENVEYIPLSRGIEEFVENYLHKNPKYKNFPKSMQEVIKKAGKKMKFQTISPHWFLTWRDEEKEKVIREELNWQPLDISYPRGSTNCTLNFLSVYLSMKNHGYTHYHIEMSKLVRKGEISRAEAIEKLKVDFNIDIINTVLRQLGVNLKVGNL